MMTFLTYGQRLIFEIDDLIFGRRKVDYSPARHMLTLPFAGGVLVSVFFLIIIFFTNIHQSYALQMCYYLLAAVISLNIVFYSPHIIAMRGTISKIGYVIFCGTVSSFFTIIFFVFTALILLFIILILTAVFLVKAASGKLPQQPFVFVPSGGGSGGDPFVRAEQKAYDLDNGDRVEFSPMTGNYVSTNPLFPREYEKNGNSFTEL